jgi:hypothetical protein
MVENFQRHSFLLEMIEILYYKAFAWRTTKVNQVVKKFLIDLETKSMWVAFHKLFFSEGKSLVTLHPV